MCFSCFCQWRFDFLFSTLLRSRFLIVSKLLLDLSSWFFSTLNWFSLSEMVFVCSYFPWMEVLNLFAFIGKNCKERLRIYFYFGYVRSLRNEGRDSMFMKLEWYWANFFVVYILAGFFNLFVRCSTALQVVTTPPSGLRIPVLLYGTITRQWPLGPGVWIAFWYYSFLI